MQNAIKMLGFLFAVLMCSNIVASLTPMDYVQKVYSQTDKVYEPVTKDMCEDIPYFKYLKICQYMDRYKDTIEDFSDDVFTYDINYWKRVEGEDQFTVTEQTTDLVAAELNKLTYGQTRKRRSSNDTEEESHNRVKREIMGNPCMGVKSKRAVLLFGLDPESGTPLELFHDTKDQMYNTIYSRECTAWQWGNLKCEIHYIEMRLPVFNPYVPWPQLVIKPVLVPAGCSLAFR